MCQYLTREEFDGDEELKEQRSTIVFLKSFLHIIKLTLRANVF